MPVVPLKLMDVLDSPVPALVGVQAPFEPLKDAFNGVTVLDLDATQSSVSTRRFTLVVRGSKTLCLRNVFVLFDLFGPKKIVHIYAIIVASPVAGQRDVFHSAIVVVDSSSCFA